VKNMTQEVDTVRFPCYKVLEQAELGYGYGTKETQIMAAFVVGALVGKGFKASLECDGNIPFLGAGFHHMAESFLKTPDFYPCVKIQVIYNIIQSKASCQLWSFGNVSVWAHQL
jgi:hypothetical protein